MLKHVPLLQDANDHGSADDMRTAQQQLGAVLQGRTASERSSTTHAALATISAAFTAVGQQVNVDGGGVAAPGWQALPLRQADWLDEMYLASAALADAIAVA